MKTRFEALVKIKKDIVQKLERELQMANTNVTNASKALEEATVALNAISIPTSGSIGVMLQTKTLLSAQRLVVEDKKSWLNFASGQLSLAKENLKNANMELEKYIYLEEQEINKELEKLKRLEARNLDEIALISFMRHKEGA